MITKDRRRLHAPAIMAVGGTALAVAALVGPGWPTALATEVVTVVATIGYYVWGGRHSDMGAMIGGRADQRQARIRSQAHSVTLAAMSVAALIGFAVQTARGADAWPFAIIIGTEVAVFAASLTVFRTRS